MIDRDDMYDGERPMYKPKTPKKKRTRKSNHRHVYKNCVYECLYKYAEYDRTTGYTPGVKTSIGTYCTKCGKIGTLNDVDNKKWFEEYRDDPYHGAKLVPTSAWESEINKDTRTLPTFFVADYFDKYIDLGDCDGSDDRGESDEQTDFLKDIDEKEDVYEGSRKA